MLVDLNSAGQNVEPIMDLIQSVRFSSSHVKFDVWPGPKSFTMERSLGKICYDEKLRTRPGHPIKAWKFKLKLTGWSNFVGLVPAVFHSLLLSITIQFGHLTVCCNRPFQTLNCIIQLQLASYM